MASPRVLVKFLTRKPGHDEPSPSGALLVFDAEPGEIFKALSAVRARVKHAASGGYLLNDGTVLAIELARALSGDPVGRVSLASEGDVADTVVEVHSDVGSEQVRWEFFVDGVPVSESGRARAASRSAEVQLCVLGVLR
jgi:hypothetical protein